MIDGPIALAKPYSEDEYLVEILMAEVKLIKEDPLGDISDAFLRIKGLLVTAKCEVQKEPNWNIDIGSESTRVWVYPDTAVA